MENIELPEPLKNLLGVGIEAGALTTFYGGPGVGKTNICLLAALDCIRRGGKVIYMDSEGGFSVERLKQLCRAGKMQVDDVLGRIELLQPKSFEEQKAAIKEAEKKNADLIILDSAVALYRLEFLENKEDSNEPARQLSKQMSILSHIARSKGIPVIATAHTYRKWDTEKDEIIGGELIKYWSKSLVFIERTGRMSERQARIVKHRHIEEGKEVKFMLAEEGIVPVRFKIF